MGDGGWAGLDEDLMNALEDFLHKFFRNILTAACYCRLRLRPHGIKLMPWLPAFASGPDPAAEIA
jgi:hypothetical protein